mmetsp:Transcript_58637/g.113127  ORF Transcript_58637/g.113127 Transcript_58637/m.113127 type:complete len:384 (+) Transcript_58637:2-1153(+)
MDHAASRLAKLDEVLRRLPARYSEKGRLRNDVAALLRQCQTLQPVVGTFSSGGRSVCLFYLHGVLPINYNGASYNIPVTIYFDDHYPKVPPRCFVTPSEGMALKPQHSMVDSGGMVYLPYLSNWSPHSSLAELITLITSAFSAQPPVYAKPQTPAQQPDAASALWQLGSAALGGLFGGGQTQSQPAGRPQMARPVAVAKPAQPQQPVATVTAVPVARNPKEQQQMEITQALRDRWRFVVEPLVDDINQQNKLHVDLENAVHAVRKDINELKQEADQIVQQEAELREAEGRFSAFIEANNGREMDPDTLRDEVDPDTRQVLDCVSEECALEEFIQALDEMLTERKITTEDFLREIRDVSRRQYMCRQLRQKCTTALAAPPVALA